MFKIFPFVLVVYNLIIYFSTCFIEYEFPLNAIEWSDTGRLGFIALIIFSIPISAMISQFIKENIGKKSYE